MNDQQKTIEAAFGARPSEVDYRTVSSDMLSGPALIQGSGIVPLNYPSVNELCNQRKLGICTKCSIRMAAEECFANGIRLDEYWGYLIGKTLIDDPMYGHFEGSSALTMLKSANKYGIPAKADTEKFPLKTTGTYAEFIASFKSQYGGKIPQEIMLAAAKHKIPGYYKVKLNPLSIASEISGGRLVIIRVEAGDNFYTAPNGRPSWDAKDLLPLRTPKYVISGHLMVINEYSGLGIDQLERGPNSWSRDWADNGYFSFVFGDHAPGYFTEAWAINSLPESLVKTVRDLPEAKTFSHTFTKPIARGQSGAEVRALQVLLSILGLLSVSVEELGTNFGPKTAAAVKAFQSKYAVASLQEIAAANGNVGPKTIAKLNEVGKAVGSIY